MEDCIKSLPKIKINHIHCSPLICQASYLIVKDSQVDLASFAPHKPLLSTPDHLLVLQIFGNGAKNAGNHHLPRDRGGDNQPVVSWILLLVLLKDMSDICFLIVSRNLS